MDNGGKGTMVDNEQLRTMDNGGQWTIGQSLVQDTDYMVEKTYNLVQYLGPFEAYLMPQWPQWFKRGSDIPK